MDKQVETIRELRGQASKALAQFRSTLKTSVHMKHVSMSVGYSHDNVRIVKSSEAPFRLDRNKYQVVVVLIGTWTMTHGSSIRRLVPTDVVKVPVGAPVPTTMETDDPDAKFVYVQFEHNAGS